MAVLRTLPTDELHAADIAALRELFDAAWRDDPEEFTDEDWGHAVGGVHFILEERDGTIVSHASVVERELRTGGHRLRTGYVEAVATSPAHRRRGHGSAVMSAAGEHIDGTYDLGALGTGRFPFYERLGWVVWKGETYVRKDDSIVRTPDEDGFVLVRLTPRSPDLDLSAPISCDWRPGDVW